MNLPVTSSWFVLLMLASICSGTSSPITPFTTYRHSIELEPNVAELWWTVNEARGEILFEYHVRTYGWIALGISPSGGMKGADIAVGWIDQQATVHVQDRFALVANVKPVMDTTTNDWFALQGREEHGWTAIQFRRALDTCDHMDVAIKSGTNILIYAYGLDDPGQTGDINYHEKRRGTRMIPLRSYSNPPLDEKFRALDSFDFRLNNYQVPSTDTTYHCKIYRVPSRFSIKRHIVAYKVLVESSSEDLVHHMTTYECDPSMVFDDANLPEGICDDISRKYGACMSNVANGWAIGGDHMVEFAEEAGYPIGSRDSVKYFMVQIHFDNPLLTSDRTDRSGVRFYVGDHLRRHDLGYLTLGAHSSAGAIAVPPEVEHFAIDTFCPKEASQRFPPSGITVLSAFPHTHLQGISVWTKLIRNASAVGYLFNAESFNFNYQFENRLPQPIKLYPGDTFITRCVYNTMNKKEITLGGERTRDEMCSHSFTYYPRLNNLFLCMSLQSKDAWATLLPNASSIFDMDQFVQWLKDIQWTPELKSKWQEFYEQQPRRILLGGANHLRTDLEYHLPQYKDLVVEQCRRSSDAVGV